MLLRWLKTSTRSSLEYGDGSFRLTIQALRSNLIQYWQQDISGWKLVGAVDMSNEVADNYDNHAELASLIFYHLQKGGRKSLYLTNGHLYFYPSKS